MNTFRSCRTTHDRDSRLFTRGKGEQSGAFAEDRIEFPQEFRKRCCPARGSAAQSRRQSAGRLRDVLGDVDQISSWASN